MMEHKFYPLVEELMFLGRVNINGGDITVTNGQIVGDLKGNVTGSATPKIHISALPEYGGASKQLYGHVRTSR